MMIGDGVLEDPAVDAILGMHNGCHLDRDTRAGDVLVTKGPSSANIFAYRAVFHGSGGHVCLARTSVNPLAAAAEAILKITELAQAHPDAVCAVTVCQGGVRNNVIPESCRIEGSVRSFGREEHAVLREGVWNALNAAAEKAGAGLEKEVTIDLMCTKNDGDLYERFCRTVGKVWPEGGCRPLEPVSMIGEDFARYTELIPGFYFFLCAKPEGARYPLHHPKFDLDESVLAKGSVLLAAFALDWQSDKV